MRKDCGEVDRKWRTLIFVGALLSFLFATQSAYAAPIIPNLNVNIGTANGPQDVAVTLQLVAVLTILSLAPSIIVMTSMTLPETILSTTTLSFLGLGSKSPSQDWGLALSKGMEYITRAPWLSIFPGIALVYTTIGFNLLGEGLRDVLDPQMRSR